MKNFDIGFPNPQGGGYSRRDFLKLIGSGFLGAAAALIFGCATTPSRGPSAAGGKEWRCGVCGYIHQGNEPPDLCPVCGSPSTAFRPTA